MGIPALTEAVYYILLSLTTPLHGYGIMQKVEALSAGRVKLAAGTLYGALSTLLERGWIAEAASDTAIAENDRKKKEYLLTSPGREVLIAEVARLRELLTNGENILEVSKCGK